MMNPYKKYRTTNIATADNKRTIVLLYEGAVKFLNLAIRNIEENDSDAKVVHVTKTLNIIQFLSNALDYEKGGEIASNLSKLYDFIRDNTTAGSLENNVEKLNVSAELFRTLLEAWEGILEKKPEQVAEFERDFQRDFTRLFARAV